MEFQAISDHIFNIPVFNAVQNMVANDWTVYLYSFDHVNPDAFPEDNPVKSEAVIFISCNG